MGRTIGGGHVHIGTGGAATEVDAFEHFFGGGVVSELVAVRQAVSRLVG